MIRIGIFAFIFVVGGWWMAAVAQTAQERAACQDDVKKLCPGVMPGGGRILDCLAKQKDKVSDACRKVLADHGK